MNAPSCIEPGCERPAVCLFCPEHRPTWLPRELERPPAPEDVDTLDLRPELVELDEAV